MPQFPQPLRVQTPSVWRVFGTYRSQVMQLCISYHIISYRCETVPTSFFDIFWAKKNPITIHHHPWMSLVFGFKLFTNYHDHSTAPWRKPFLGRDTGYDGKDEGLKMTQMEESHKKSGRKLQFQKSSSSSTPNGETHRTGVGLKSFFLRAGTGICPKFPDIFPPRCTCKSPKMRKV